MLNRPVFQLGPRIDPGLPASLRVAAALAMVVGGLAFAIGLLLLMLSGLDPGTLAESGAFMAVGAGWALGGLGLGQRRWWPGVFAPITALATLILVSVVWVGLWWIAPLPILEIALVASRWRHLQADDHGTA